MEVDELSLFCAIIALVISFISLIRSRKAFEITKNQNDYIISPRVSFKNMELNIYDGQNGNPDFTVSADIYCHSNNSVKLLGVYLEYGSKDDEFSREKKEVVGPLYIDSNRPKKITISSTSENTYKIAKDYALTEVYYWLTIVVSGVYGEEIIKRYEILEHGITSDVLSTRCPPEDLALT
ncbi:conserved hypothetical protein [Vibrio chagasii]|nr:conserved hypothetical protein [Vibrio chagasii]CAH7345520.1 conserved hypothetical protein [Vibrio chagasii]CAH7446639.1 conserved hypothetical protein [Vibrio chagasii]